MMQANKDFCYFWAKIYLVMKKSILLVFIVLGSLQADAQKKIWVGKSSKIFNFQFHYTHITPGGDFASRFNEFNAMGAGFLFKNTHNMLFGAEGGYHFGNNLKPSNLLNNLTNSVGAINTNSGTPALVSLGMRGFSVLGKLGYLIPVSSKNRNTGIKIMLGGGLVMHKININITQNNVPSLTEERVAGYDRYSSGWAFSQFVGYQHHSVNRYTNFYVGAEMMQAYTYNRRKFNYDEMQYDLKMHNDFYYGVRFAWMIPVYLRTKAGSDEFIFE